MANRDATQTFDWIERGFTDSAWTPKEGQTPDRDGNLMVHANIIRGVAHPPGEPDTYNGLKFTTSELREKYHNLPGTIVYDNHDLGRPIGKVIASKIGDDGSLCVDVVLNVKRYEHAKEVLEKVMRGSYRGMSLGCRHQVDMKSGRVPSSDVKELSLCPQGALPRTDIYSVASKDDGEGGSTGLEKPFSVDWCDVDSYTIGESPFAWTRGKEGHGGGSASPKGDGGGAFRDQFDASSYMSDGNGRRHKTSTTMSETTTTTTTAPPSSSAGDAASSISDAIVNGVMGGFASQGQPPPSTESAGGGAPAGSHAPSTGAENTPGTEPASSAGGGGAASQGSSGTATRKVDVLMDEYEELLNIRNKYQKEHELFEQEKKTAAELAKELENTKKTVSTWENIASTLSGSSDSAEAQKILEDLNNKEIAKFLDKLNEIMPEMEKAYEGADPAAKKWMESYILTFRNYMINRDKLKDPKTLEGARGMVEIMTRASRDRNTRFAQKEAEIKELQRKFEEEQKEKESLKRKAEDAIRRAELLAQSGSRGQTIKPTVVGASTPVPVDTAASASSPGGAWSPPNPFSGGGGLKRIRVAHGNEEAEIEVAPWNLNQGRYSSLGDQLPGNKTFAWIEKGISTGAFLPPGVESKSMMYAGQSFNDSDIRDIKFAPTSIGPPW